MARRCPFCGSEFLGQKSNFEHVLPRWLVKEADLKARTMPVTLGGKTLTVAMSRIGGKSCESCNSQKSDLEGRARTAYVKIRDGFNLEEEDLAATLDWLDKVRVGLWLWSLDIGKSQYKFAPKFRINQRISSKDRLILISKYPPGAPMLGLEFWGTSEYFIMAPSVLGLLINNIALISVSTDFITLRHLRDIQITRWLDDTDREEANLLDDRGCGKRLKLIGNPDIFGQTILREDISRDYGIHNVRKSAYHTEFVETPVSRLNYDLSLSTSPLSCIKIFAGNKDAHIALMKLNVCNITKFIIDDYNSSDFSRMNNANAARLKGIFTKFSADEEAAAERERFDYWRVTGIRLPA